ncbi:unnamed protein product [Spirodela intermedia]|uniref:Uncharacterized protein n=1 Tax=Spirodela intermedia TaxID=51605 RepID=A0A7I8IU22_SPIIN|nr:unnamed protein product [Spirodela intermedia]CAA6661387.1 unnamed protein product [Spirodela intermedia]
MHQPDNTNGRENDAAVTSGDDDDHRHQRRLPDFLQSVRLKYVKLGYHYLVSNLVAILFLPVMILVVLEASRTSPDDLRQLWHGLHSLHDPPPPIYLVDYACYRPPDHLRARFHQFVEHARLCGEFDDSSFDFQVKVLERSGLGDETYVPEAMHHLPPRICLVTAREETEQVMFGAMDALFRSTAVRARDIGILVVNCSLFNPTPSLSAMIVNRMGCSAGVIALDLAKDLLQVHSNTYAVVVSTENITQNWYFGNRKSMLIPNCLFRVGGAAVLLSNRRAERKRAKYRLMHVVRTHRGADDRAFRCVYQEEDGGGKVGVSLSKDVMAIAGGALKANITTLGPLVLPISEQLLFFATFVANKLFSSKAKPYIPDFKLAFEHFCIHAGGRAVIDELEKNLQLLPAHVEASRMTLHRFGNTSSSSIWYELAGFKCNSAVWQALRTVTPSPDNPWNDCIDKYPVELLHGSVTYLGTRKQ